MTLGDVIERQKIALGIPSNRKLAARVLEKTGRGIHHATISNWVRGVYRDVSLEHLDALAQGIADQEHPYHALLAELREAAGLPDGDGQAVIDLPELTLLDRTEVRFVENLIRMLARAKRGQAGADPSPDVSPDVTSDQ